MVEELSKSRLDAIVNFMVQAYRSATKAGATVTITPAMVKDFIPMLLALKAILPQAQLGYLYDKIVRVMAELGIAKVGIAKDDNYVEQLLTQFVDRGTIAKVHFTPLSLRHLAGNFTFIPTDALEVVADLRTVMVDQVVGQVKRALDGLGNMWDSIATQTTEVDMEVIGDNVAAKAGAIVRDLSGIAEVCESNAMVNESFTFYRIVSKKFFNNTGAVEAVTQPCVGDETGVNRDCGWVVDSSSPESCPTGATFNVRCNNSTAVGSPMLRLCPGDTACTSLVALLQAENATNSVLYGECRDVGSVNVTVLSAPFIAGENYTCDVVFDTPVV